MNDCLLMSIFAMSDALIGQIITGAISIATLLVTSGLTLIMAQMKQNQERQAILTTLQAAEVAKEARWAAVEVSEVKSTLHTTTAGTTCKLDALTKVAEATHTLVNNNMAMQLHLNMMMSRRLAELTEDHADIVIADAAERKYREHEEGQQRVDQQAQRDA